MCLIIRCGGILDDESRREVGDLMGEFGFFNTGKDFVEILVGIGCFVDGILSSIEEDVVIIEFLVNRTLVEGTLGGVATEDSSRSVVHRVA